MDSGEHHQGLLGFLGILKGRHFIKFQGCLKGLQGNFKGLKIVSRSFRCTSEGIPGGFMGGRVEIYFEGIIDLSEVL